MNYTWFFYKWLAGVIVVGPPWVWQFLVEVDGLTEMWEATGGLPGVQAGALASCFLTNIDLGSREGYRAARAFHSMPTRPSSILLLSASWNRPIIEDLSTTFPKSAWANKTSTRGFVLCFVIFPPLTFFSPFLSLSSYFPGPLHTLFPSLTSFLAFFFVISLFLLSWSLYKLFS